MKQLFIAILLVLALAAPAFSTDVTIAAHQVPGFQPSNLGQPISLTVSVTNGSATVLSASLYRQQWVGLGGFRVSISGTFYYVQSVDSLGSLTLTSNFSGATGSATLIVYPYVEARLYSSISFYPLGSNNPVLPGAPNGGPAFRRYAASIINVSGIDTLYLPQMVIPATIDGTPSNQARITMAFHRPDGALVGGAAQSYTCNSVSAFRIPTTTPTSWKDICTYNAAPVVQLPETYVTTNQLNSLLPSCTANQMIYFAATGRAQACATVGSGLQLSGGVLSATAGTSITGIREAVNVKRDHSCVGDGVADDTACIVAAITAAQTSGKQLYFPAGTYLTDTITQSLSNLVVVGDGYKTSILKARNANTPIINLTGINYAVDLVIQDLGFVGQGPTSGSSGHCVVINDVNVSGSGLAQATLRNVHLSQCGGKGLYVPRMFNVLLDSVVVDQVGGNGFELHGSNTTTLVRTYVKTLSGANTAAYRIYAGTPTLIGANGIDSCPNGGCDWAVLGRTIADDGVDSYVRLNCTNCNIEDFKNRGIYHKYYSSSNFFNTNFFAPTSGTVTAIKYDFVDDTIQGIFDGQSSIVTQGASWASGYPIHSNANPFHSFSITTSPYNAFWNGTDAQTMPQWGYQFASGISRYLSRSTGLAADLFQVGTSGLPAGYQSFFKSTATGNIGLAVGQITGQTAPPFVVENDSASPIFRVTTTGIVQANAAGSLAFTVQDTGSNALFRATRASSWLDSTASAFVQLGGSGDSGWFSGLNGAILPRLGISAIKTQFTDTDTGSAAVPGSNLLGLYKTTDGNIALEIKTSTVQTGDIISYHNSSAVKFKVDASGYATTERLRLTNVAGDPSSPANGDIAYNSSAGKFRCYQAGAWTDCIGTGGGPGTVTSVALAVANSGLAPSISGSPITTSGTITVNLNDMCAGCTQGLLNNSTQTLPGAKTLTSLLTATQINPSNDNMYTFGATNLRWSVGHFGPSGIELHADATGTAYTAIGHSGTTATITHTTGTTALWTVGGTSGISLSTAGIVNANGSGGINATAIVTGTLGLVRGGTGQNSWSANQVLVGTGSNTGTLTTIPDCDNATTSKLLYDNATQAFTCGTDQSGAGGTGITTFNTLTTDPQTVASDTNVTWVSAGSTHTITWAGTLAVARGGSGAGTLTGILLGNGTSAFTALTTSAGISGAISDETGSGALVFGTAPTIAGGTHTAITGLGIRSTGTGAFDLQIINTENLTGNKALTITVNDGAKTLNLGGNLTTAAAFITTGANSLTLNTGGATVATLPAGTITLADLTSTQTFTNKTLTSPVINFGSDANGDIITRQSGAYARLAIGSAGQCLIVSGGLPVWGSCAAGSAPTASFKTANYTTLASDRHIMGDATGGSFTVTFLAAGSASGTFTTVCKYDSSVNTVTATAGSASYVLSTAGQCASFASNGTSWFYYVP